MKHNALKKPSLRVNNSGSERLYSSKVHSIPDAEQEKIFDNIAEIAMRSFSCEVGAIVLIEDNRVFLKSAIGISVGSLSGLLQICEEALMHKAVYEIADLTAYPHLCEAPLMKNDQPLRYFAAAPIRSKKGEIIGVLCVADILPRGSAKEKLSLLSILAGDVRLHPDEPDLRRMELSLNQKNAELENIIYSLSHDLRGPISSILGLLNVEKYASEEDLREYFKMIHNQALKMDSSIHDLVQLKNVTNKSVIPADVDVHKLISKLVDKFTEGRVAIQLECDEDLILRTDSFFVQTALEHTLSNAVHFHAEEAEAPCVKIKVKEQRAGIIITISDNGVGIGFNAMPRLFEMFYRGSSLSDGHGLGLYTTKNALERIKASIVINSKEGAGTEVALHIPHTEGYAHPMHPK